MMALSNQRSIRSKLHLCIIFLAISLKASNASASAKSGKAIAFNRAVKLGLRRKKEDEERRIKGNFHRKLLESAVLNQSPKDNVLQSARRLADDGYAGDDGDDGGNDFDDAGFGFEVSEYSVKYTRCQAISTYSDDLAEDAEIETVLKTQRFVVFRLCPSDSCVEDSKWGCSYDFGEYIIEMGAYLEAMQEYRAERAEAFCDFCEECMANENLDDGGRRLADDAYAGDDAAGDDAGYANDNDGHSCAYYDECYDYVNICAGADDDNAVEYEDFFECQAFENKNGEQMYVGPHCASDGQTIKVDVYYDEYCSKYAGDDIEINYFTNMPFTSEGMEDYYKQDCISCLESELPYNQIDDDVNDNDQITELCENLYYQSAKCNRAIGSVYGNQNEENVENMVCYFIENIVEDKYDEYGEIYINNFDYKGVVNMVREQASDAQIVFLSFNIFTVICLFLYSCILHRKLTSSTGDRSRYFGDISRQDSGIVLGRSKSGGSFPGGIMA